MKLNKLSFCSSSATFVAALTAAAGAQLVVNSVDSEIRNSGPGDLHVFSAPVATNNGATGTVLRLVGDWSKTVPIVEDPEGMFPNVGVSAREVFSVGNIPIEVYGLTIRANAKWVNGGGNDQFAETGWTVDGRITSAPLEGAWDGNNILTVPPIEGTLTGNGYRVINQASSLDRHYVLSANRTYALALEIHTWMNAGPNPLPDIVVTNEFGGVTEYAGFEISFNWRAVPAPGVGALAAIAIPMVARRRRYAPAHAVGIA